MINIRDDETLGQAIARQHEDTVRQIGAHATLGGRIQWSIYTTQEIHMVYEVAGRLGLAELADRAWRALNRPGKRRQA